MQFAVLDAPYVWPYFVAKSSLGRSIRRYVAWYECGEQVLVFIWWCFAVYYGRETLCYEHFGECLDKVSNFGRGLTENCVVNTRYFTVTIERNILKCSPWDGSSHVGLCCFSAWTSCHILNTRIVSVYLQYASNKQDCFRVRVLVPPATTARMISVSPMLKRKRCAIQWSDFEGCR